MTEAQEQALQRVAERWDRVGVPQGMIGGSEAIVVSVGGTDEKPFMWLAIEPDGHTHS